jgi:hypothetical protein
VCESVCVCGVWCLWLWCFRLACPPKPAKPSRGLDGEPNQLNFWRVEHRVLPATTLGIGWNFRRNGELKQAKWTVWLVNLGVAEHTFSGGGGERRVFDETEKVQYWEILSHTRTNIGAEGEHHERGIYVCTTSHGWRKCCCLFLYGEVIVRVWMVFIGLLFRDEFVPNILVMRPL